MVFVNNKMWVDRGVTFTCLAVWRASHTRSKSLYSGVFHPHTPGFIFLLAQANEAKEGHPRILPRRFAQSAYGKLIQTCLPAGRLAPPLCFANRSSGGQTRINFSPFGFLHSPAIFNGGKKTINHTLWFYFLT